MIDKSCYISYCTESQTLMCNNYKIPRIKPYLINHSAPKLKQLWSPICSCDTGCQCLRIFLVRKNSITLFKLWLQTLKLKYLFI